MAAVPPPPVLLAALPPPPLAALPPIPTGEQLDANPHIFTEIPLVVGAQTLTIGEILIIRGLVGTHYSVILGETNTEITHSNVEYLDAQGFASKQYMNNVGIRWYRFYPARMNDYKKRAIIRDEDDEPIRKRTVSSSFDPNISFSGRKRKSRKSKGKKSKGKSRRRYR
jgi:hypothetical protein